MTSLIIRPEKAANQKSQRLLKIFWMIKNGKSRIDNQSLIV